MDAPTIPQNVQSILTRIRGDGDLRVWSVIVTIMGDTARGPGETVSGATLGALMGALGIRPEATRVALHRLRKDGWITSQRAGRGSLYALTEHGRAQTHAVADVIYGPGPAAPTTWHLVITVTAPDRIKHEDQLASEGFAEVAPGVFLGARSPSAPAGLIHFSDRAPALPDDLLTGFLPEATLVDARRLGSSLALLDKVDIPALDPLSKAALRILILHDWRRIALRLPPLPLPPTWPEAQLRNDVHRHLNDIGPINLHDLST